MDFSKLESLKRLPSSPVWAVFGDEPFFKRRAVDKIVDKSVKGQQGNLGLRIFDLEGPEETRPRSPHDLFADVFTPSLFAPVSVVVVYRAGALFTKKDWGDALEGFLAAPPSLGVLVLELDGLDKRRKLAKTLIEVGQTVECKRLFDRPPPWEKDAPLWKNPLSQWIAAEGKRQRLKLTLQVAQGLADRVGNDPGALHEELVKLALYKKAEGRALQEVTESDLSFAIGDYNEFGVFRLTDAVGAGDLHLALKIANGMFEQGLRSSSGGGSVDPRRTGIVLVDRIHAKMSEVFRARALLDQGGSRETVGKALGKHRVFLPVLVGEAKRWSLTRVHDALDALFDAERRIKSGGSPRMVVEALLVRLLTRSKAETVPAGRNR